MKKNKMMRIASVLLVAVLLSTCAISGTFAKFTSKYTGSATATVASWAFDMNGETIKNNFTFDLGATVKEIGGDAEDEVKAGVIAPGTQGSFNIMLKNNSDVTAKYMITIELENGVTVPVDFDFENTGDITYGGAEKTITVNWKWEWSENDETQFAGKTLTANIIIQLDQKN